MLFAVSFTLWLSAFALIFFFFLDFWWMRMVFAFFRFWYSDHVNSVPYRKMMLSYDNVSCILFFFSFIKAHFSHTFFACTHFLNNIDYIWPILCVEILLHFFFVWLLLCCCCSVFKLFHADHSSCKISVDLFFFLFLIYVQVTIK